MQSGLAASAAVLLPFRFAWVREPELFVFDERFPGAVATGRVFFGTAARIVSVREVFTRLWYDELDQRWRRQPMTLAGVTTGHVLHVLETLALDRRMRVSDRAAFGDPEPALVSWSIEPVPRYLARTELTGA